MPCGHLCVCLDCVGDGGTVLDCPVCRAKVHTRACAFISGVESLEDLRKLLDCVTSEFVAAILLQVEQQRAGQVVDRTLLGRCLLVLSGRALGLEQYRAMFEVPPLNAARASYENMSREWLLESDSVTAYKAKVRTALVAEGELCPRQTHAVLEDVCFEELVGKHREALLGKLRGGSRALVWSECNDDLSALFRLIQDKDGGLELIAAFVQDRIIEMGKGLLNKRVPALVQASARVSSTVAATGTAAAAAVPTSSASPATITTLGCAARECRARAT